MTAGAAARSRFRTGAVFAFAYAALALTTGQPRPLFDGFAPPPPYNWVRPPKEFAAGNTVPKPSTVEVAVGAAGSAGGGGSSSDGQVILSFKAGAFAAHGSDTKVGVLVTPLDPATIAAPPPGLQADGNGYRLEMAYQPSGQAAALTGPADVFLVVPQAAQALLYSADGQTWENLPFRPVPDPSQIGGSFPASGYLMGVAPPAGTSPVASGGNGGSVGPALLAMVGLAAVLWLAPVGWSRLRRTGS